ncbi:MAG: rhodanese-like domain-containing protein [Gammaproteobacteria bacterium]|nr:rhodanese-like domain-containing protein [Gammaproteobacteria bacterium]
MKSSYLVMRLNRGFCLVAAAVLLAACDATTDSAESNINAEQWSQLTRLMQQQQDRVSAPQLADWIIKDTRDFEILDLRETSVFASGHIDDARQQGLDRLLSADGLSALARHKKQVVVSQRGQQAAQVAALLRLQGIDAYSLDGGYDAWLSYTSNPADDASMDATAMAQQQAVACYFAGDYVAVAGLTVKVPNPVAGYTPPLIPVAPAEPVDAVEDPLGLGLGLGMDEDLEPDASAAPTGLILGEGC